MQEFFNVIGNIMLAIFFLGIVVLYFRNLYKLYIDVQKETYGLLTVARVVGIFVVFLGVLLGMV